MSYICPLLRATTVFVTLTANQRPESECSQNLSWRFELRTETIRITQKGVPNEASESAMMCTDAERIEEPTYKVPKEGEA